MKERKEGRKEKGKGKKENTVVCLCVCVLYMFMWECVHLCMGVPGHIWPLIPGFYMGPRI